MRHSFLCRTFPDEGVVVRHSPFPHLLAWSRCRNKKPVPIPRGRAEEHAFLATLASKPSGNDECRTIQCSRCRSRKPVPLLRSSQGTCFFWHPSGRTCAKGDLRLAPPSGKTCIALSIAQNRKRRSAPFLNSSRVTVLHSRAVASVPGDRYRQTVILAFSMYRATVVIDRQPPTRMISSTERPSIASDCAAPTLSECPEICATISGAKPACSSTRFRILAMENPRMWRCTRQPL